MFFLVQLDSLRSTLSLSGLHLQSALSSASLSPTSVPFPGPLSRGKINDVKELGSWGQGTGQ